MSLTDQSAALKTKWGNYGVPLRFMGRNHNKLSKQLRFEFRAAVSGFAVICAAKMNSLLAYISISEDVPQT